MGSFRSLNARQLADTAQFTNGLGEKEWIRYWTRLPHSIAQAISSAAASPDIDRRGRILGINFDAGKATSKRLQLGIVDWHILDEEGNEVRWDSAQAATLLDGLDTEVVEELTKVIGNGNPEPDLEEVVDDADGVEGPSDETVGEDLAVSLSR